MQGVRKVKWYLNEKKKKKKKKKIIKMSSFI